MAAGSRAFAAVVARTGAGAVIPSATVTVYDPNTTDMIAQTIYVNNTDNSTYTNGNFQTGADGIIEFWLDDSDIVDVLFTKSGFSSQTIPVKVSKESLGYNVIQEEGTALTSRDKINFIGSGVTAADDAGNARTNVTITAASGITVSEDGTPLDTDITTVDFLGADFDLTESPENEVNVAISSAIARDAEIAAAYQALSDHDVFRGARVRNTVDQSIADITATSLTWDAETFDTDAIHSTASNTSRLVLNKIGYWRIYGVVAFAANATGLRQALLLHNGGVHSRFEEPQQAATGRASVTVADTVQATAITDYVELQAYQESGGALNVSSVSFFGAEFIGG